MILIEAILRTKDTIEVSIHKKYLYNGSRYFYLFENGNFVKELHIERITETNNHFRYIVNDLPQLKIGQDYEIQDDRNTFCSIDCSVLMKEMSYDHLYKFDGEMGAIYHPNHTIFRVFSPLASSINLVLFHKNNKEIYAMKKRDNGIFYYNAIGDYDGFEYLYQVKVNGKYVESIDPYTRSTTLHSRRGVVINPNKYDYEFNDDKLSPLASPCSSVIYEMSVRDFTSSIHTSIKHKGKYLGLTETNKVSTGNNKVGLDYLSDLGVTHVQLLPVTDFLTTNDQFPENTYNWGYDSGNMFALEGSYSSNPSDPYSRIHEFKKVVSSLHERNIRVIVDMVFNHQFTVENSSFEKILPNYYFRFNPDGTLSNGSFCGNEFESRRYMARKFIVDTCLMFVKEFHVDGFRFDLMGILDIDTVNEVCEYVKSIKSNILVYGEGWDMPSFIDEDKKSTITNAKKLKNIGFFNDYYRESLKYDYLGENVIKGNYMISDEKIFDANQSINYLECHDNYTYYDLQTYVELRDEKYAMKKQLFKNLIILISNGYAFYHSGQEFFRTKQGIENSYCSLDKINGFDWNKLYKHSKEVSLIEKMIRIREKHNLFMSNYKYKNENNVITLKTNDVEIVINLSDKVVKLEDKEVLLSTSKKNLEKYDLVVYRSKGV